MKKFLVDALKLQKTHINNMYSRNDILLNFINANVCNRTFTVEKSQISDDYIEKFEEFYTIIDIGENNSFILLDKDDYYLILNSNNTKNILKYYIFPALEDEVCPTAIINDKFIRMNSLRIPLLGQNDILSIIDDNASINL